MSDLKSRYEFGWFSAYDTLKGMINIYGIDKVREAIDEIESRPMYPTDTSYRLCPNCSTYHPISAICPPSKLY